MNQWTTQDWIGIGNVLVSLAALIVTAITVFLSYWDRRHERQSRYSEALYAKQIEAYDAILVAAIKYFDTMPAVLKAQRVRSSGDIGRAIYSSKEHETFTQVHRQYITYLPREVTEAILDFAFSYTDVKPEITRIQRDGEIHEELLLVGGAPHDAYTKLVKIIRRHIGTDELTPKMLELLGPPPVETAAAPTTVITRGDVPFIGRR